MSSSLIAPFIRRCCTFSSQQCWGLPTLRAASSLPSSSSSVSSGSTFITNTDEEWLRVEDAPSSSSTNTVMFTMGLTGKQLDELGDPVQVTFAQRGIRLPPGQPLATVHWRGFRRTESDELYHAVWSHSQGAKDLALPFESRVEDVNVALTAQPDHLLDPDEVVWVIRVEASAADFLRAVRQRDLMPMS